MAKVVSTLVKDLRNYQDDKVSKAQTIVVTAVKKFELGAKRDAPRFIKINSKIEPDKLNGEVGVMGNDPLSAYFEFGTGLYASWILAPYPQWIKDIAMQFYVNGEGKLRGKPYLFPNFFIAQEWMLKELNKLVK